MKMKRKHRAAEKNEASIEEESHFVTEEEK